MKWPAAFAVACSLACTTPRPLPPAAPRPAEVLASRLAEADRLASRGCYLCLKEAAAAYGSLLEISDDRLAARRALENNLMLALREVELRMPDSGARGAAEELQPRVGESYAAYFGALDALAGRAEAGQYLTRQEREERVNAAASLEREWPASPMKAYFYLAMALNAGMVKELKPQLDAILSTHSQDLSLQYRVQAFLPTFSEEASRALIGRETGFGEVHFLLGQRAVLDARLADAHRELTRARVLLPDSAAIALVLANVTMAYARYPEALALYDRVVAAGPDQNARLGRARALSYLGRHTDAITVLDELLQDLQDNPGEKHYWRAWNHLRLSELQAAYDDATAALKAMRNNEAYRLAGIASFNLNRLGEARGYFIEALRINRDDCDAERYLGQLDAVERVWQPAAGHFAQAVACCDAALIGLRGELAELEQDITGLSNALIATRRGEIREAEGLRANAATNAAIASKNAP